MAETEETELKAVASQLRQFAEAARRKDAPTRESKTGFPRLLNVAGHGFGQDIELATYEECVGKLSVEQRGELGRLIEIMSDAFRDRSGAIP